MTPRPMWPPHALRACTAASQSRRRSRRPHPGRSRRGSPSPSPSRSRRRGSGGGVHGRPPGPGMEKRAAAGPDAAPGARAQLAVVCLGEWAARARRGLSPASVAPHLSLVAPGAPLFPGCGWSSRSGHCESSRRRPRRLRLPGPRPAGVVGLGGRLRPRSPGSRPARKSVREPG